MNALLHPAARSLRPDAMTIVAGPAEHQQFFGKAVMEGLHKHGVRAAMVDRCTGVPTLYACCWGWHGGARLRQLGHEVFLMERGYLGDRFAWTSLSWNGLNGRAELGPKVDDGGRRFWHHFGHLMRPWNPTGAYALVIGQVPGDASLEGRSLYSWYDRVSEAAKAIWGLPVCFREHPQAIARGFTSPVTVPKKLESNLQDAIGNARVVITWNSNTAVESVLAGKPTIVFDQGSMAWDVTTHQMADVPDEPDRESWAAKLAWKQWTVDEIRSGEAWQFIGRPLREPTSRGATCP